jgi:hypothetical protein
MKTGIFQCIYFLTIYEKETTLIYISIYYKLIVIDFNYFIILIDYQCITLSFSEVFNSTFWSI